MKRFLVFAGYYYYPNGGMNDFKEDFNTLNSARDHLNHIKSFDGNSCDWGHILDILTGEKYE
jgi:hypothetical protein